MDNIVAVAEFMAWNISVNVQKFWYRRYPDALEAFVDRFGGWEGDDVGGHPFGLLDRDQMARVADEMIDFLLAPPSAAWPVPSQGIQKLLDIAPETFADLLSRFGHSLPRNLMSLDFYHESSKRTFAFDARIPAVRKCLKCNDDLLGGVVENVHHLTDHVDLIEGGRHAGRFTWWCPEHGLAPAHWEDRYNAAAGLGMHMHKDHGYPLSAS
ncbi:hypothetical protein [Dactylosporangium sucinum]|nr:hypothetical protein [Dactylosporangium sucinum]